nr:MipA/OmpV family protein [Vibrio taketomensis]
MEVDVNNKFFPIGVLVAGGLILGCVSGNALANISQWSLGAGVSYSPAVYKDTPSNKAVVPIVGYEGEHFFMRGFTAGYRLYPIRSTHNVVFRLAYDPRTLKPSDSDDPVVSKMDKREATVFGGVSYQLMTRVGMFETTAGTDIGGKHNGLYGEVAWRLPYRGRGWGITPSIGYSYNSDKINNHLYGVSQAEAARAGIEEFDADWDGQYFIGLSGYFHLTPQFRLGGGVRYINLEGDIEKSPLIESGINTAATFTVTYIF